VVPNVEGSKKENERGDSVKYARGKHPAGGQNGQGPGKRGRFKSGLQKKTNSKKGKKSEERKERAGVKFVKGKKGGK